MENNQNNQNNQNNPKNDQAPKPVIVDQKPEAAKTANITPAKPDVKSSNA